MVFPGGLKRIFCRLIFQFVYIYYVGWTMLDNNKSLCALYYKMISIYARLVHIISCSNISVKITFGTNGIMIILWSSHRRNNNNRIRFTSQICFRRLEMWNGFNLNVGIRVRYHLNDSFVSKTRCSTFWNSTFTSSNEHWTHLHCQLNISVSRELISISFRQEFYCFRLSAGERESVLRRAGTFSND